MNYHNEIERRRCPIKIGNIQAYRPKLCEFYNQSNSCPNDDRCIYCHGNNELQFHPMLYKMRLCKNIEQFGGCQYEICSYAHNPIVFLSYIIQELRKPLKYETIDVEKFDMSDLGDFTIEEYAKLYDNYIDEYNNKWEEAAPPNYYATYEPEADSIFSHYKRLYYVFNDFSQVEFGSFNQYFHLNSML